MAESEQKIYLYIHFGEQQCKMLAYVAKQRAQLERSFRTAIADMKQSQQERNAQRPQPLEQTAQAAQPPAHQPAEPQTQPPGYVMSEGTQPHPVFCSTSAPDSR